MSRLDVLNSTIARLDRWSIRSGGQGAIADSPALLVDLLTSKIKAYPDLVVLPIYPVLETREGEGENMAAVFIQDVKRCSTSTNYEVLSIM